MTPDELLPMLRCPKSKAVLVADGDSIVSTDPETRLRYAVRESIPIMLIDEAESVSTDVWGEIMRKHGRDSVTGQIL